MKFSSYISASEAGAVRDSELSSKWSLECPETDLKTVIQTSFKMIFHRDTQRHDGKF